MQNLDPQDRRPDRWSPDPQIVTIDPADVRLQLVSHPDTNELVSVNLMDARGDLLVQMAPLVEVTDDTIILTG